jgi:excisionase family DNA binding protein
MTTIPTITPPEISNPSMRDMTDTTRLMTIDEARDRLRISRWSMYRLINDRQIKTITIGSRRFITPHDFDQFIQSLRS